MVREVVVAVAGATRRDRCRGEMRTTTAAATTPINIIAVTILAVHTHVLYTRGILGGLEMEGTLGAGGSDPSCARVPVGWTWCDRRDLNIHLLSHEPVLNVNSGHQLQRTDLLYDTTITGSLLPSLSLATHSKHPRTTEPTLSQSPCGIFTMGSTL